MIEPITCQQILEASPQGVMVFDDQGRLHSINSRAEKLLCLGPGRAGGEALAGLSPGIGAMVHECLASGRPQPDQTAAANGVLLAVRVEPIRSRDKNIGCLALIREKKNTGQSALNPESSQWYYRQLEAIFRNSPDGIWISDKNGVVLNINDMAEENNAITAADVAGQPIYSAIEKGYIDISATAKGAGDGPAGQCSVPHR